MASYTGPAVDQLTNIGFNDDGCGGFGTGSVLDFDVTAGTMYSIAIDGWEVEMGDFTLTYTIPAAHRLHLRRRHLRHRRPATASAASAPPPPASATTSASATAASAAAAASAATTASAASASAATAATGALPRAAADRAQARCREDADPQGQLPCRHGAPRSHEAIAARPRRRPEPEARRDQGSRLPCQPAGWQALDPSPRHPGRE